MVFEWQGSWDTQFILGWLLSYFVQHFLMRFKLGHLHNVLALQHHLNHLNWPLVALDIDDLVQQG